MTHSPLETLRHHVTGAIERGEGEAIIEVTRVDQTTKLVKLSENAMFDLIAVSQDISDLHDGEGTDVNEAFIDSAIRRLNEIKDILKELN